MGTCEDLTAAAGAAEPAPSTTQGCTDCIAEGRSDWVHLRKCLTCGHVACCDSSPAKHASAHYRATGHPVMRSLEAGESWRWCFVHETIG